MGRRVDKWKLIVPLSAGGWTDSSEGYRERHRQTLVHRLTFSSWDVHIHIVRITYIGDRATRAINLGPLRHALMILCAEYFCNARTRIPNVHLSTRKKFNVTRKRSCCRNSSPHRSRFPVVTLNPRFLLFFRLITHARTFSRARVSGGFIKFSWDLSAVYADLSNGIYVCSYVCMYMFVHVYTWTVHKAVHNIWSIYLFPA